MRVPARIVGTVRFAVVASACALLTACPFDKPEDHLARGKEQAAKQNHEAAAIEFKNYLQSVPRSTEARFLLGRELLAQGQLRAAEIELQKAYDGRYDRDLVAPLLVEAQVRQGEPEKILPQIARTELKTPQANARLQVQLGRAALLKNNLDDALRAFRSAQQYEPGIVEGRLGEARVDAMRNDFDTAKTLVAKVLEKAPNNVDALVLKGDIALKKNAAKEATDAYLAAIALDAHNVQARLTLAGIYVATNAIDRAQQQVDELKKLAPRDPGVTYLDALLSFDKKDYLHANDAVTLSLNANPNNGAAQILSGAILLAMKQPAQAESHLIEGLRMTPNSIYARRILTGIYLRQNQPQKAIEVLQPALAALPNDGTVLTLAGEIAVQQGDYANASKYFERATQIDPKNTDVRVRAAATDLARGDDASGFAALEAAVKSDAANPRTEVALVLARLSHHQYDQALAAWKQLDKLQPNDPATYNLRAAIDLGRKDQAAARAALEHAIELQPTFLPAVKNLAAIDEADGRLDVARQRYKTLLAKDKTNTSGLIGLAEFEARHDGKTEDIVELLQQARRSAPNAEQPTVVLANFLAARGNTKQALAVAQEAHERAPNNLTYARMIGDLQLQSGAADQAIAAYRQLIVARPQDTTYQVRLAQAMVLANQADLAAGVFEKAIKEKPDFVEAQTTAISTMIAARKLSEANRLLAVVQKAAPASPALPELDADVKLASKQYAEAAAAYGKIYAQAPRSALMMKQYLALKGAGRPADASALAADWLKGHPSDVDVRLFEGDQAMLAKDYARATTSYRKALELQPANAGALNNLAWVLWQQKDPQAVALAEKARTLAPESPSVNDTLGWMLVDKGETRKGLDFLQKARAAAPNEPAIALHVAKAQLKDGQKDAARVTMQSIVRSAPQSPEAKESRDLMATL